MEDLINSVQERYRHAVTYRNFSTLAYHMKPPETAFEPKVDETKKKGLFDFFRPQISGISKKLHSEISKLLDRRERTVLRTIDIHVPRLIHQHTKQWKTEFTRAEKNRVESVKRTDKRIDLVVVDTGKKMKAIQLELDRLKAREKKRLQEQARIEWEGPPLSHKATKRLVSEYAERERNDLLNEIGVSAAKTERRVVRKLRDEEEYEKRRRG